VENRESQVRCTCTSYNIVASRSTRWGWVGRTSSLKLGTLVLAVIQFQQIHKARLGLGKGNLMVYIHVQFYQEQRAQQIDKVRLDRENRESQIIPSRTALAKTISADPQGEARRKGAVLNTYRDT
jgi:hypothetical protein